MMGEQVFLAVLELDSPSDRAAYLDRVCGGNAALRRHVEDLLAAHFKPGEFLDEPVGEQFRAGSAAPNPDVTVDLHARATTRLRTSRRRS